MNSAFDFENKKPEKNSVKTGGWKKMSLVSIFSDGIKEAIK